MDSYTYIADLPGLLPEAPEDSIVSRTFFAGDGLKAILFRFAAGQELSEHTSSQTAILHFLEGEADVTLGDDALDVRAGGWVYMPPRLPHSIRARTPLAMLLVMFEREGG